MNTLENSTFGTTEKFPSAKNSRRELLTAGLGAIMAATPVVAAAQNMFRGGSTVSPKWNGNGNSNVGGTTLRSWVSANKRLLRKINYGPTQADLTEIETLGYSAYLEKQLNPATIDDSACDAIVQQVVPGANRTLTQWNRESSRIAPYEDFTGALILKSVHSKRQLLMRTAEFWREHFSLSVIPVRESVWAHYQRDVIEANALTTFRQILRATANSGAMMIYLDNFASSQFHINVNYAREILELHTVGVNGGYTEADIYEVARIFTGWTAKTLDGDEYGEFEFRPADKLAGSRTVMGQTFSQSGKAQGDALIDWLSAHPSTIHYVCTKLVRWFLNCAPSSNLLSRLAQAWGTEGDIKALLRIILSESEVMKAKPEFKRPFHLMVGALRQAHCTITSLFWIRHYLKRAGHEIGWWIQPDGYPIGFSYWAGGMIPRIRMLLLLSSGQYSGVTQPQVSGLSGRTGGEQMAELNRQYFLGELPVAEQVFVRRYLKRGERLHETVGVLFASPTYQWF
jgi:uncharacterized protein (DUF1800 family)